MISPDLDLETILQAQVEALSLFEARSCCPAIQVISIEAEPKVAAGVLGPVLVMSASVCDEKASSHLQVLFRFKEKIHW